MVHMAETAEQILNSPIKPQSLTPATEVVKQAVAIYRRHFSTLMLASLVSFIIAIIRAWITTQLPAKDPLLGIASGYGSLELVQMWLGNGFHSEQTWLAILGFVLFIVEFWYVSTLFLTVKSILDGQTVDLPSAYTSGLRRWPGYLGLTTIIVAMIIIGLVLFVVPGILFLIWYAPALYVYFDEDRGVFESLGRSKQLTRGRFWELSSRLGNVALIVGGVALVIAGIVSLTGFGPYLEGIVTTIISPVQTIAVYLLFRNLKSLQPA